MSGARLKLALLVLGVLTAPAPSCARSHAPGEPAPAEEAESSASLRVANNYSLAMEVFTMSAGVTTRVGTVSPGERGQFVLAPATFRNGTMEVLARPTGGGRLFRSGPLGLEAGQVIELIIASDLIGTTAAVW